MTEASAETTPDIIEYAEWGELFYTTAVTQERILAGVNALSGQPINMGPMGVGPGRVAKVTASGQIGTATGQAISDTPVAYAVRLPVSLEFSIDLGVDVHRFTADIEVPLRLTARARDDLSIYIEITPPERAEIAVKLKARGLRATFTQHAANVEGELRRFIAKYVAREVEKPHVQDARIIDVAAAINRAAGGIMPKESTSDEIGTDLSNALEEEILLASDVFVDEAVADAVKESGDAEERE